MDDDSPELIDQRVAVRIHARRVELGITLQSLAREIGVAFQQAHKYERGQSRISAGRLYRVARALKVPVGFFFKKDSGADTDTSYRVYEPTSKPAATARQLPPGQD